jgi:hypothetical protein
MKKYLLILAISILGIYSTQAQDVAEVDAKGIGIKHDDALQDALRNAVSQAAGVVLRSETKVENFEVVSDAISTHTSGYITSYTETKSVPLSDRVEVTVHAKVSLSPLKADINLLSKSIGGVRFLVMYDPKNVNKDNRANYDLAVERINNYLSQKKYRYIEKSRFESLKNEAHNIAEADEDSSNPMSYVQHLGIMSDAQFIILITNITIDSKSEAFETRTSSKITIEAKAYDNCTAEGLGTVLLESGRKSQSDMKASIRDGVSEAVTNGFDKLLNTFTSYIGDWVNNGTPYELRFYNSGTFRDFRELKGKLKNDPNFGGDFEIVNAENYTKLNCTFRKKPDELADKVLDYSDDVPTFKAKNMDVKFIYGRQISFAPHNTSVPGLPATAADNANNGRSATGQDNGGISGTAVPPKQAPKPALQPVKPKTQYKKVKR